MTNKITSAKKILVCLANIKRSMQNSLQYVQSELPPSQLEVLWHLDKRTDMSIKQVAHCLRISPSAATQLIEPLVKAGFLLKNTDPTDRRSVIMHVSPVGKKTLESVYKSRIEWMTKFLEPLDEAEADTLVRLFEKLTDEKRSNI